VKISRSEGELPTHETDRKAFVARSLLTRRSLMNTWTSQERALFKGRVVLTMVPERRVARRRALAVLSSSWGTNMAQVAKVAMSPAGEISVLRVVCACVSTP
jgi:hypothetical protein